MKYIDLHTHSNESDGTYTPGELVAYAISKKLSAIALTDHDTVSGLDEALAMAADKDIELIPGIEFSTAYHGKDIHILGLLIDYKDARFQESLLYFQENRDLRNDKIIQRLQEHQIDISKEQLYEMFGDTVWTRAHFARYLINKGLVKDMQAAFAKYLGDHAPCFVPREKITPWDTIKAIRNAGGIPILAHPLRYGFSEKALDQLVCDLSKQGLMGIEAIYTMNQWMDESHMKALARKYHLAVSGGSDFHGDNKPQIDLGVGRGNLKIPMSVLDNLKTLRP
jgi:predicted metal-dependent phosphoesterase TrpH